MTWNDQSPLVAALAAAIIWLTLELKKAQTDGYSARDELVRTWEKFADRMASLYETRVGELRGLLEDFGRSKRELES